MYNLLCGYCVSGLRASCLNTFSTISHSYKTSSNWFEYQIEDSVCLICAKLLYFYTLDFINVHFRWNEAAAFLSGDNCDSRQHSDTGLWYGFSSLWLYIGILRCGSVYREKQYTGNGMQHPAGSEMFWVFCQVTYWIKLKLSISHISSLGKDGTL